MEVLKDFLAWLVSSASFYDVECFLEAFGLDALIEVTETSQLVSRTSFGFAKQKVVLKIFENLWKNPKAQAEMIKNRKLAYSVLLNFQIYDAGLLYQTLEFLGKYLWVSKESTEQVTLAFSRMKKERNYSKI